MGTKRKLELTGQVFGRLTVVSKLPERFAGQVKWLTLCSCGKDSIVYANNLRNGKTVDCGCVSKGRNVTWHGLSNSPEYHSWRGMKERCNNPKNSHYKFYGEKGIGYAAEWDDFNTFYSDMGNRPAGMQLDRIDVNLGYSKDNCRWTDLTLQAFNIGLKSNNKSGRTGVYPLKSGNYYAVIKHYKKVIHLGTFNTFEKACEARAKAELELYGFIKK